MYIEDSVYHLIINILKSTLRNNERFYIDHNERTFLIEELEREFEQYRVKEEIKYIQSYEDDFFETQAVRTIKSIRIVTGCSLRESKQYYDSLKSASEEDQKQFGNAIRSNDVGTITLIGQKYKIFDKGAIQ